METNGVVRKVWYTSGQKKGGLIDACWTVSSLRSSLSVPDPHTPCYVTLSSLDSWSHWLRGLLRSEALPTMIRGPGFCARPQEGRNSTESSLVVRTLEFESRNVEHERFTYPTVANNASDLPQERFSFSQIWASVLRFEDKMVKCERITGIPLSSWDHTCLPPLSRWIQFEFQISPWLINFTKERGMKSLPPCVFRKEKSQKPPLCLVKHWSGCLGRLSSQNCLHFACANWCGGKFNRKKASAQENLSGVNFLNLLADDLERETLSNWDRSCAPHVFFGRGLDGRRTRILEHKKIRKCLFLFFSCWTCCCLWLSSVSEASNLSRGQQVWVDGLCSLLGITWESSCRRGGGGSDFVSCISFLLLLKLRPGSHWMRHTLRHSRVKRQFEPDSRKQTQTQLCVCHWMCVCVCVCVYVRVCTSALHTLTSCWTDWHCIVACHALPVHLNKNATRDASRLSRPYSADLENVLRAPRSA